jgi:uncharacterized membrane protein
MPTKTFSNKEALLFGWETFNKNAGFFIVIIIVMGLANFVPGIIANIVEKYSSLLASIINLTSLVLVWIIEMGLIKIILKFCDNQKAEFNDLFSCTSLFFKFAAGAILYGLIAAVGYILLIVPGIIWTIQFGFFSYLVVDKGLGPIVALKRSSLVTRGAKMNLFVFGFLILGINILGALCLLIGLFVSIPVSMIAGAYVYRKLLSQTPEAMASIV